MSSSPSSMRIQGEVARVTNRNFLYVSQCKPGDKIAVHVGAYIVEGEKFPEENAEAFVTSKSFVVRLSIGVSKLATYQTSC
jgi:hypothetical protein